MTDRRDGETVDVLLVCSTGGHLLQLHSLRAAWQDTSHAWVTFDKSDARSLLAGEEVHHAYGPTNRNLGNLFRNLGLAWRLLRRLRPRVVVTTGAGVAVPFCWIGRALGARVVYVESLSRIESPSLSYRMIAPVAARVYGQWPEFARSVRRARYVGSVFSRP
jgi:UDP-N-acetylglucosamine:LPS N-acetylglucosamine transferase